MAKIGITLRSVRIERGLTIEQVAQDTRISARFLEALEAEAFSELPAPVYVRGFLRSYATYLRLDAPELLEQLDPDFGGGTARTVPNEAARPAQRKSDPFRSTAPGAAPPPPSRPRYVDPDNAYEGPVVGRVDPFSVRRIEPETPLDSAYESPYRRGRVGGMLVERGAVYGDSGGGAARVVALVGAALILLLVFAGVAFALNGGGGGGDDDVQGGNASVPPATAGASIVVGGTRTATTTASATRSATSSVTASAAAEATSTSAADATATPTPETAAPTATPTSPPPAPTPTAIPPTPVPPTPTPVPTPAPPPHGSAFSECPDAGNGQPNCGTPLTVVCDPAGQGIWFVDHGNDFPKDQYGWPYVVVTSLGQAINAGQSGCS